MVQLDDKALKFEPGVKVKALGSGLHVMMPSIDLKAAREHIIFRCNLNCKTPVNCKSRLSVVSALDRFLRFAYFA